jgi:hypothetical protein
MFRSIGGVTKGGGERRKKARSCTGICVMMITIGMPILERWKKNFNGRPFFSWFFVARANQKIRILGSSLAVVQARSETVEAATTAKKHGPQSNRSKPTGRASGDVLFCFKSTLLEGLKGLCRTKEKPNPVLVE